MTKVTCDMCGCTLLVGEKTREDRVKLLLYGPLMELDKDLCVACATRVNNKLCSFIAEVKEAEKYV